MIDRVIYNGRSELDEAKILNMSVAKYFGLVKEYAEILRDTKKLNEKVLDREGEKAELNIMYAVRYNLNYLIEKKLVGDKNENSKAKKE